MLCFSLSSCTLSFFFVFLVHLSPSADSKLLSLSSFSLFLDRVACIPHQLWTSWGWSWTFNYLPKCWDYRCVPPCPILIWYLEIKPRALYISSKFIDNINIKYFHNLPITLHLNSTSRDSSHTLPHITQTLATLQSITHLPLSYPSLASNTLPDFSWQRNKHLGVVVYCCLAKLFSLIKTIPS